LDRCELGQQVGCASDTAQSRISVLSRLLDLLRLFEPLLLLSCGRHDAFGAKTSPNDEGQEGSRSEPDQVRQAEQNAGRRWAEEETEHLQACALGEILE
jgi:hypothetical protein